MSENKQRMMRSPGEFIPKDILDKRKEGETVIKLLRRLNLAKPEESDHDILRRYNVPTPLRYLFYDPGDDEIKSISEEGLKQFRSNFAPTEKKPWKGPLYKLTEKCYKIHLERRKTEKTFLNQLFKEAADEWLYKDEEITVDQLQNTHDTAYNEGKYDI